MSYHRLPVHYDFRNHPPLLVLLSSGVALSVRTIPGFWSPRRHPYPDLASGLRLDSSDLVCQLVTLMLPLHLLIYPTVNTYSIYSNYTTFFLY